VRVAVAVGVKVGVAVKVAVAVGVKVEVGVFVIVGDGVKSGSRQTGVESPSPAGLRVEPYWS